MSLGSQIKAFCTDVNKWNEIWLIEYEEDQFLEWFEADRTKVIPVWSSESRVEKALTHLKEFGDGVPSGFTFDSFAEFWVPELEKDGVRLGPNWVGKNLNGTTFGPMELINRVKVFETSQGNST